MAHPLSDPVSSAANLLPAGVEVIVRGWLNANHILFSDGDEVTLVDSGYGACIDETIERLAARMDATATLTRLINTHCHSDHIGGNAAIKARFGCEVIVPAGAAPFLDPWDESAFWLNYSGQMAVPFTFDATLADGATFHAGGQEWQVYAAPGHDMMAQMFFAAKSGLLISGDALWESGLGVIEPEEGGTAKLDAALATLDLIESLAPRCVIPGHGAPFADASAAIARARGRLEAFKRDPAKGARHFLKVMLVFSLLEKQRMSRAEMLGLVKRAQCYADLAQRFLNREPTELVSEMIGELLTAGAVAEHAGWLTPRMPR